jgi:hypothetical protein
LEAQVDGRRSGSVRAEDGVCELEEGVGPAVEAFVERASEGSMMRTSCAHREFCASFATNAVKTQGQRKG